LVVRAVARLPMRSVKLPTPAVEAVFDLRRRAAGLRRKEVTVGRFTLPYLEGGNPVGKPLVLVHGFSDTKDSFVDVCRGFGSEYRVVLPDLPGFAEASSPLDFTYGLPAIAEVIAGFFDTLGLHHAHTVGSSLGGAVLVQLALMRPELVHSMSLLGAAGLRMPVASPLQQRLDAGDNPFVVDSLDGYDAFMRFVLEKQPPMPAPIRRHLAEVFMSRASLNEKIMADLLAGDFDLTPQLSQIQADTLLLWGDHDRLIDISAGRAYHQHLPRARMVIFHGIGHCPQYECPERTAGYVGEFLQTLGD
jgi:pimeloyl-ACP methyl ester carboxylesterase